MKKFLISCFYLTITVIVCTASFFLPSALNSYQDRLIFAKIEHTATEPPELTYSSSLFDTLRLFSQDHYFVEYPSTGSKRTDKEIYTISLELLEQLKEYELLLPDSEYNITNHNAALQLAIVSDEKQYSDAESQKTVSTIAKEAGQSLGEDSKETALDITTAVVWSCSIYFESGYWIDLWIDDKSGKTVAFSMFTDRTLEMTSSGNRESLDAFASTVTAFLENYYELPATSLQQSFVQSYHPLFEKDNNILEAYYTIQLKEENGSYIEIPLKIRPECTIIN